MGDPTANTKTPQATFTHERTPLEHAGRPAVMCAIYDRREAARSVDKYLSGVTHLEVDRQVTLGHRLEPWKTSVTRSSPSSRGGRT